MLTCPGPAQLGGKAGGIGSRPAGPHARSHSSLTLLRGTGPSHCPPQLWGHHWTRLLLKLSPVPGSPSQSVACFKLKYPKPGGLHKATLCTELRTAGPCPPSPPITGSRTDAYKTSRNLALSGRERNTSPLSLRYPGTATNHTKTPTELLFRRGTRSPSHSFNFRRSQLSQRLPRPQRTTEAGFLRGPGLLMCRARRRIAFAEAMNDLSPH